jgi:hypothetical protein
MTNTPLITLTMPVAKFTKLKSLLKSSSADAAYFPYRQLRGISVPKGETSVTLNLNPQEFENLKGVSAKFAMVDAEFYLDLIFDVGQPQFDAIVQQMREEAAAKQTGLGDLKEVTVQDIKQAKAKSTKAKKKA